MSSLSELWVRLGGIEGLQFQSESRTGTGWTGSGAGNVEVNVMGRDTLIFSESGQWQQNGGKEIRFVNCYRRTRWEHHLCLEHLRFGPANPVFLFDLVPGANGVWNDVNPHLCRDDCYSATLEIGQNQLLIDWSVHGPTRDESIKYVYF